MVGLGEGEGALLTNELIHNTKEFSPDVSPTVRWLAGGTAYTTLEAPAGACCPLAADQRCVTGGTASKVGAGEGGDAAAHDAGSSSVSPAREIIRYDAATGVRTVLVDLDTLTPEDGAEPLSIQDYDWSEVHVRAQTACTVMLSRGDAGRKLAPRVHEHTKGVAQEHARRLLRCEFESRGFGVSNPASGRRC